MNRTKKIDALRDLFASDDRRITTILTWMPPLVGAIVGDTMLYGLGKVWTYPVPFTSIFCGFPSVLATFSAVVFILPREFRKDRSVRSVIAKCFHLILATLVLAFVFPLIRIAFEKLRTYPGLQAITSLFLPILKYAMRDTYLLLVRGDWLCDAPSFCFVVDGFSAFFTLSLFHSVSSFQVFLIMVRVIASPRDCSSECLSTPFERLAFFRIFAHAY